MKLTSGRLSVSPTDLSYFLACRHRTALELSVAHGVRTRPEWDDPLLEALFALGLEHEREYVQTLEDSAASVVSIADVKTRAEAVAETEAAMRAGADVIIQAALENGAWYGRPDVMLKTARPAPALGGWSYEIADTKLARETRGGTILQLGLYCTMLGASQGLTPERFYVVTPGDVAAGQPRQVVRTYRVADFAAYVRLLQARLARAVTVEHQALADAHYPDPVEHCDICPWSPICRDRRRRDDHLSLVAGITRLQRRELEPQGVATVEALAAIGDPIPFTPTRGARESYARVRDQARMQVASRRARRLVYELIPPPAPASLLDVSEGKGTEPVGLQRLPAPSPGDVFLDLEGDPLAGESGREYLFGLVTAGSDGSPTYQHWWADDPSAERQAFEAVVDLILARLEETPGMHVYHYAPYEPAAFKRLMGRFASREQAIDRLLRGRRFVDLYGVVRQGVRAGVERYSIKNLEPLYQFTRAVELRDASRALRLMEQAYELDRIDLATPAVRHTVVGYNRDDCVSTLRLRDWLEARRADLVAAGTNVPRPPLDPGEAPEKQSEDQKKVAALRARLLDGVPDLDEERSDADRARVQLAYLLDWHRREDKAGWWEYFRLRELPEDDLYDEPAAIAGLAFAADVGQIKKSVVRRHSFPVQEVEIRRGAKLKTQDGKEFGEVVALDRAAGTVDILVGPSKLTLRPTALFEHDHVSTKVIEQALFALGERVADAGGVDRIEPSAEQALLLRATPALASRAEFTPAADESSADFAVRSVTDLDRTSLAVQGPPGSGKTFTGARMILALVALGRRVGVTATSHKVIANLLEAVAREAAKQGVPVRLGQKGGAPGGESPGSTAPRAFTDNDAAIDAVTSGEIDVLGGTAWLWAHQASVGAVDVLFVDEAGQMSLANVLGVARACRSLVLLGDPQQLEQPTKGAHPDGVGVSALQHVLGDAPTMPPERGLFLPVTWRLPPAICQFTSEVFYDGQLTSKAGLEQQQLTGTARFEGSGLWVIDVDHDGNRNVSDEEAAEVSRVVAELLAPGSDWIDRDGVRRPVTADDIRIVAPFNAHVTRIQDVVMRDLATRQGGDPRCPPVGTVDRFQGQEAPVVIYAMAASRPEDAPRGMSFLYSLNRLNVATSRARCAAILIASPRLFEPECHTPHQMRLANALCRYRELARRA